MHSIHEPLLLIQTVIYADHFQKDSKHKIGHKLGFLHSHRSQVNTEATFKILLTALWNNINHIRMSQISASITQSQIAASKVVKFPRTWRRRGVNTLHNKYRWLSKHKIFNVELTSCCQNTSLCWSHSQGSSQQYMEDIAVSKVYILNVYTQLQI